MTPTLLPPPICSPTPTERYVRAAHAAGCPADQVRNFLRAGIVLQPKQLEFAAAARACDSEGGPVEVALGGARGPGKSHALLCQLGDDGSRHPGLKMLLLRKVGASAKEGFEGLLPKTIGRLGAYTPSQGIFRFHDNGSWIRLGHFQHERDVDKYLGLEYDVVALEEATTLSAAKKTSIFSCCRSPVGSGWRARKYLSTNPGGVGHAWFKARFVGPCRDGCETDTRFIPCTVDDNRFASVEYVKFLDGLTGWLKRAWRYGDWDIAAGQYFTTWRRDVHVIAPPDTPYPTNWRFWLSLDYGFVHYTMVYLLAQAGDGDALILDEHGERRWLVERHCAATDAMLARHGLPKYRIERFVADPSMFSPRQDGRHDRRRLRGPRLGARPPPTTTGSTGPPRSSAGWATSRPPRRSPRGFMSRSGARGSSSACRRSSTTPPARGRAQGRHRRQRPGRGRRLRRIQVWADGGFRRPDGCRGRW